MRTLRLARTEIARHSGLLPRLAVLFLLLVPCLYGALYLWSNWDPYGELRQVPVAVVNRDQPVTVDDHRVAAGDQLLETMQEDPVFGWVPTDATDAAAGLAEGRYYMTITIPENFSANLASGADGTPRRAEVRMRRNDANGYVVGIMAESVQSTLHGQINSAATEAYFESVYGNLDTLRNGLVRADDGAHELADGLGDAEPGASRLTGGLGEAANGAAELSDGANQVADGTQQIADVVNPLADEVVPRLPKVATGAADVAGTVAEVADLAATESQQANERARAADDALDSLVAEHPDLADDPAVERLREATSRASDRSGEIADRLDRANDSAQRVNDDARQLVAAVPDLQQRIRAGQQDVNRLNVGAHQVANGADELAQKLPEARDGAAELSSGVSDASDGATELADGLDTMLKRVPALDPDTRERNAAILGDPTDVDLTVDNPAHVYGRGLAPFFFAIALWVFGIVVFLVLRPTTGRALASTASPVRIALAGWLPIAGVGLAGAFVLFLVAQFGLGLDVVDPLGSIATITVAVVVFTLIAHLARTALGLVGSSVLLVLLMLQLAASGGIYPVETLPSPLRAIHPYLPMTYLIDALRVVFTGGSSAHLTRDLIVLGAVGAAALLGTCLVIARRRTWSLGTVHPALS